MKVLSSIFLCVILSSCDCYVKLEGTIVDRSTGKPIDGAIYKNQSKNWISNTTDSSGRFHLTTITDPHCKLEIRVEKPGYLPLDSILESGTHVLKLIPSK